MKRNQHIYGSLEVVTQKKKDCVEFTSSVNRCKLRTLLVTRLEKLDLRECDINYDKYIFNDDGDTRQCEIYTRINELNLIRDHLIFQKSTTLCN